MIQNDLLSLKNIQNLIFGKNNAVTEKKLSYFNLMIKIILFLYATIAYLSSTRSWLINAVGGYYYIGFLEGILVGFFILSIFIEIIRKRSND